MDIHSSDNGTPCDLGSKSLLRPPPKKKYIYTSIISLFTHCNTVNGMTMVHI